MAARKNYCTYPSVKDPIFDVIKKMTVDKLKRTFIAIFYSLICCSAFAQTIKTGVLVVGAGPAGTAAAIQSAHSGVKTLLVDKGNFESLVLSQDDSAFRTGIYAAFLKRVESAQKYPVTKNQTFSPAFAATIFKAWADTVKNLSILTKVSVSGIRKDGKGWIATLSNKKEVKADVIVEATPDHSISAMASVNPDDAKFAHADSSAYASGRYRTGIAIISPGKSWPVTLPAEALVRETENFILTGSRQNPATIFTGQGAGAVAAYCSFFKTTTKKLNVRLIQSELINFGSRLIRFDDISDNDSNAVAIQSIALTGILRGKTSAGKFNFMPDSTVSSEEIKLPVKEYYSRSQIWFLDNRSDKLTLKDLLSLIKFTASRGEELNREVEKGWHTSLKLPGKFDLNKPVTRREVAALFNAYLKPFNVFVDMNGELKR